MDRDELGAIWQTFWKDGIGAAPLSQALTGLSPAQAAWVSGPGRRSIRHHVNHVVFWREVIVRRVRGGPRPSDAEIANGNWGAADAGDAAGWRVAQDAWASSHRLVAEALADPAVDAAHLFTMIPHDAYHLGQIMCLRAMQGLAPLE